MLYFFATLISSIGFLMGYGICYLGYWLPNRLFHNWRIQAWSYLYPNKTLPGVLQFKPTLLPLRTKYRLGIAFLSAVLSFLISLRFGVSWVMLANIILVWGLLLLALMDACCYVLPDCIVMPLLWLGLLCNTVDFFVPIQSAILGVIGGYLILWIVAGTYKLIRKKEGIGQGDFKLLALLGAWWGVYSLPSILMMATFSGATIGIVQILRGRSGLNTAQPFGPYLALASIIFMFFR